MYSFDNGSLKDGEESKLVMVPNTDRTKYSIELSDIVTGEYEFKIVVHIKGWNKRNSSLWNGVHYAGADGADGKVEITFIDNGETIELFDGVAQAYSYCDVSVTLVVKFDNALPEEADVFIPGSMNNWGADLFNDGEESKLVMVPNTDRTKYSIELSDIVTGEYEFKIVVHSKGWDRSASFWQDGIIYSNADGYNARVEITIIDDGETIELFDGVAQVYAE